jgi:hypothetical protein
MQKAQDCYVSENNERKCFDDDDDDDDSDNEK